MSCVRAHYERGGSDSQASDLALADAPRSTSGERVPDTGSLDAPDRADAGAQDASSGDARSVLDGGARPISPWSVRFGAEGWDTASAVATSGDRVYVCGVFDFTSVLGGGPERTSAGSGDVFLASFELDGVFGWSLRAGGTGADSCSGLALDAQANLVIAGTFADQAEFGGPMLASAGNSDGFVASYDRYAVHRWSRGFGGTGTDQVNGIAVDALGISFIVGQFRGTAAFGSVMLTSAGAGDGFLASYDSAGQVRWARALGGPQEDSARAVAVDRDGRLIVAGEFRGTVDLAGTVLTSAGGADVLLASYDTAGELSWARRFGGRDQDAGHAVVADAQGNVFLGGQFETTANFGGVDLTRTGTNWYDGFLASYERSGQYRWSRGLGTGGYDSVGALAIDARGNLYATGYTDNTADLGGGPIGGGGGFATFVASYDTSGAHRLSRGFGGDGNDGGSGIAVDRVGNVFVAGDFYETGRFGGAALLSDGNTDGMLFGFAAP